MDVKKIASAFISVYNKDGLENIIKKLHQYGVVIYASAGTLKFIHELGIPAIAVETITQYPVMFQGRVKTLHPKIIGGILAQRDHEQDNLDLANYQIPAIDLVIVNLYPVTTFIESKATEEDIIEKIDIGGITLIRAAAKNYKDVAVISSTIQYDNFSKILDVNGGYTNLTERRNFAGQAFELASKYDHAISNYFKGVQEISLRYGENPHQKALFIGNLNEVFEQKNGKEISYNNLVDLDAGIRLLTEFNAPCFVIIKHTNPCGIGIGTDARTSFQNALACDPTSAFGGILATNQAIDLPAAECIQPLFFEALLAPAIRPEALQLLSSKKNRIILISKEYNIFQKKIKSVLNGTLIQDADNRIDYDDKIRCVTSLQPNEQQLHSLKFAFKICKHLSSNAIVLAQGDTFLAAGMGQTSRIEATEQAIIKAQKNGSDLNQAVLASDGFFPFSDALEKAAQAGIKAVIQPGGSMNDAAIIEYCNHHQIIMVFTGVRHFKH